MAEGECPPSYSCQDNFVHSIHSCVCQIESVDTVPFSLLDVITGFHELILPPDRFFLKVDDMSSVV